MTPLVSYWISVKDELPHKNEMVIGYSPELEEDGHYSHYLMWHENNEWFYCDNEKVELEITHWFNPDVLGKPN